MKVMDFEEITRPVAAAKDDTLLLCENTLKSNTRVRLFYNDGTMSSVIEVESSKLSEKSKRFCTRLLEFVFPTHRFLKVDELDEIKIMLKLMGLDILTTPADAAKRLGVDVREIDSMIAQDLLKTTGGKVWLAYVKKLIDKGHTSLKQL
jgi:hypothetical protein